jgi:uncharacterized protein (DUF2267 family)
MSDDSERDIQQAAELHERIRAAFDQARKEGDEALRRHDRTALTRAIEREGEAIEQHVEAVRQLGRVIDKSLNE